MEPITKSSTKIQGTEVLFFEDAEVEKIKGSHTAFATVGPLSVLYFKDLHRFVLQINDWRYPIMRRLAIVGVDKNQPDSRSYILPAPNGFSFNLNISKVSCPDAIKNFETILSNNSRFYFNGEPGPERKLDLSPTDKLVRQPSKETGPKEVISEIVKGLLEKVRVSTKTMKTHTKNINSTKQRMNLKDIKNKDWKKDAHSTFKKGFFENYMKETEEFLHRRRENENLKGEKSYEEIRKNDHVPKLFIDKQEIQNNILNLREMIAE